MADELLDLVDAQDNVIGTVWKSAAHKNNHLIHREIAVRIFNHKNQILMAQRSFKKSRHPGEWNITCAGHVGVSEDPMQAATREIFEELGIKTDLKFIDKNFADDGIEARFFYSYYGFYDASDFVLQEEEVESAKWVDLDKFEEFSKETGFPLDGKSHIHTLQIIANLKLKNFL